MKPIVTYQQEGTPWEVQLIDGIMVEKGFRQEDSKWLNNYQIYGSQKKPKHLFKRSPKLSGKLFVKDLIIISTKHHIMVSKNEDFSDWILLERPLALNFIKTLGSI